MRPATQIVQGSQGSDHDAEPLTTPIYETTTFVFENAAEVRAYNEGGSAKFLYPLVGNPAVGAEEKPIASIEGAETAMLLPSGQAATTTALLGLMKAGDEVNC